MASTHRLLLSLAVVAFTTIASDLPAQEAAIAPSRQETKLLIPATDVGLPGAGPIRRADWFQTDLTAGPDKELKEYKPQAWDELVVTVKGGVAHCTCNGEVLETELEVPATGPIGLEGDRGQMEYRRIRIKESR